VLGVVLLAVTTTAHARDVRTFADVIAASGVTAAEPTYSIDLLVPPPPPTSPTLDAIVKAGMGWRLDTERGPVHVWIPAGYDPATAATVVFVHGYWTDVDRAWTEYRLPEQFAMSGINAMFIAGGAPYGKGAQVVWPSLTALLATVAARIDVQMPKQRLVAMGHSGAYRTLALWLDNHLLDSIVLLDAVYGEYRFAPWARGDKSRRLVNIAYETGRFSDYMHRLLPGTVRVDGLPSDTLPEARIVYVKTSVGHFPLVTDGIAIPLSLRALALPRIPLLAELPLGLPLRCEHKPEHVEAPAPPAPVLPPL
jgi:hypothetical protein